MFQPICRRTLTNALCCLAVYYRDQGTWGTFLTALGMFCSFLSHLADLGGNFSCICLLYLCVLYFCFFQLGKNIQFAIFLDTVNVINILCVISFMKFDLFISLSLVSVTLTGFKKLVDIPKI